MYVAQTHRAMKSWVRSAEWEQLSVGVHTGASCLWPGEVDGRSPFLPMKFEHPGRCAQAERTRLRGRAQAQRAHANVRGRPWRRRLGRPHERAQRERAVVPARGTVPASCHAHQLSVCPSPSGPYGQGILRKLFISQFPEKQEALLRHPRVFSCSILKENLPRRASGGGSEICSVPAEPAPPG